MPERKLKCSYREGSRRCPFHGIGNPPLCPAHQVAVQEAARPRSATEVLAEATVNLLQGKPINSEATIGAMSAVINQWATGLGADYRPDVGVGEREDAAHRRARPGPPPWWAGQRGAAPPTEAPDRAILGAARRVMGFAASERIDEDTIKARRNELAKKFHPDRAGRDAAKAKAMTERMSAINRSADILLGELAPPQRPPPRR